MLNAVRHSTNAVRRSAHRVKETARAVTLPQSTSVFKALKAKAARILCCVSPQYQVFSVLYRKLFVLEINLSGHAVHSAQSSDCVRLARSDRIFYSPLSVSETSVADISTKS